jgi:Glyoxalase-like domain
VSTGITGIDHLMVAVADEDKTAQIFAAMGFAITPTGRLPGMANRLICFAGNGSGVPNFVEFMATKDEAKAPPAMAAALKGPDRPVLMVAATQNAMATRKSLAETGLNVSPVIESGRNWTLPTGEVIDLAFSILLPEVGQAPLYWIGVEHKTPQHYLRSDFTAHPNGATALSTIIAIAGDPQATAQHYADVWGAQIIVSGPDLVRVEPGEVRLEIHTPQSFAASCAGLSLRTNDVHIAGFAVRVDDLEKTRVMLKENGFTPEKMGEKLVLDPARAAGCVVIFET